MFVRESRVGATGGLPGRCGALVARERSVAYSAGEAVVPDHGDAHDHPAPPRLGDALAALREAHDLLAEVHLDGEDDAALRAAAVELQQLGNRHDAHAVRLLGKVDRRGAYGAEGAVTAAAWYRGRTNMDAPAAARMVQAAHRLRRLPELAGAFADGAVSLAHVSAVTSAAIPRRMQAIAALEGTLCELARQAPPRQVRIAVKAITDQVDPDGGDTPPLDEHGPDERRDFQLHRGIDGLWNAKWVLDPLAGEALATLLDSMDTPEPADTPEHERRSAGQRRADILDACVRALLDGGFPPSVHGAKPHILATIDLLELLGLATHDRDHDRAPRLRHGGATTAATIRRLAWQAKITAVLTLGPWRVVSVGRTMRTLPAWLRSILQVLHGHCRGPDCDRPATWADAHHVIPWLDGGDTDLNATIPVCRAHHGLLTDGTWQVAYDPDTGTCTWTGPTGQTVTTSPPA